MELERWIDKGFEIITTLGPKIMAAVIIWIIGAWAIRILLKNVGKVMDKRELDLSLKKFLLNLFGWLLKVLLILAILGTLGIETTSFAAVIAASSLAVGMALQGSLANFAGGVLIMIFKPFKVGDLIEAQGQIGSVKEIEIFTTKLIGNSNKEIIIPNGILSNGTIVNYSTEGTRRVDLVFGVSYDANIKEAKEIFMNVLLSNPNVLKTPEPTVNVLALADSSVNFAVRPWCLSENYWRVYFDVTEQTKLALDAAGIEIPYPHQVAVEKK